MSTKMSHKIKPPTDHPVCEKYITKVVTKEKVPRRASTLPANYTTIERLPAPPVVPKQTSPIQARIRSFKNRLPSPSAAAAGAPSQQPLCTHLNFQVEKGDRRNVRQRYRSTSSCSSSRSMQQGESWAQLLASNKSRDSVSTFSNYDPLRTLHFLSKELFVKLLNCMPDEGEVHQMVQDIQHALKRIPPEVSSLIHMQTTDSKSLKSLYDDKYAVKPKLSNKVCQTPPTLYQEDSEGFHRVMEENTRKLAVSCQQLEMVCTNLQQEKEITEKELENSRNNVAGLKKQVTDLESEIEKLQTCKVQRMEEEKRALQERLDRMMAEANNNSTMNHLRKMVDEMRLEKSYSDQARAKLEYDITLLSLEKEKFVTILAVRDREIKDIQEEMTRIQEQVSIELKKLHVDVLSRAASVKSFSDNLCDSPNENKENFIGFGDATTISSVRSDESAGKDFPKESPSGDADAAARIDNNVSEKGKITNNERGYELPTRDFEASLQDLLKDIDKNNAFLSKQLASQS